MLFRSYSSEKINTGIPEVDAFEDLKTFDVTQNTVEEATGFADNQAFKDKATSENAVFDENNPFGEV